MILKLEPIGWSLLRNTIFILAVVLTVYFGFFAYFDPPVRLSSIYRGPSDRYLHIGAFFMVTFFFLIGRHRQWLCFIVMIGFAVGLEAVQFFHPTRVAGWDDLAASLAGVVLGATVAAILRFVLKNLRPRV